MTNLHKKLSLTHIISLTGMGLAAVAIVAVGATMISDPEPVQAQSGSCRLVTGIPGEKITLSYQVNNPSYQVTQSDSQSETHEIDYGMYTGTNEYVDKISFNLETEGRSYCDGSCSLQANVQVLGVSVGVSEGPYGGNSIDQGSFTRQPATGDTSAEFDLSAAYDMTVAQNGEGDMLVTAEVSDIELTVCDGDGDGSGGNIPPDAVNDGSTSDPIHVDFETGKAIDVLDNDDDPDDGPDTPLKIVWALSQVGSSVSVINGGSEIWYDPHSLDYGDTDEITYTITDGADTDTATAYIQIAEKTGKVTINNPNISFLYYQPRLEGTSLPRRWIVKNSSHEYTFEITEESKLFEIPRGSAEVLNWFGTDDEFAGGDDWITKEVAVDFTNNDWSAELGRTYEEEGSETGDNPPTADFTYIPGPFSASHNCATDGLPISFTDQSSDPDGDSLSYNWSFEGGGSSSQQNPSYTFPGYDPTAPGWQVDLYVTDGNGNGDGTTQYIPGCSSLVSGNQSPNASFTSTAVSTEGAQHEYQFDASGSNDPDGSIDSYEWDIANVQYSDGTQAASTYTIDQFGEVVNGFLTNPRDDTTVTYTIQLIVTDNDGAADLTTRDVDVTCNDTGGAGGGAICVTEAID